MHLKRFPCLLESILKLKQPKPNLACRLVEKYEDAFLATVKERYCLNPGSERETYHLVIDLGGSRIEYTVGDCLGIFPQNDLNYVKKIAEQFSAAEDETIEDRDGKSFYLSDFLANRANLNRHPNPKDLSLKEFCKKLSPIMPRFYSIASSMEVVGSEAHLTVGLIAGTCSQYLCKTVELGKPILPVFHHRSRNFSLTRETDDKPIIMIGPGTGIAPFRGFVQERIHRGCSAKNWLFFGERFSNNDFYYKSDWAAWMQTQKLDLSCAFSRDQPEKVYVQHKMLEESSKLWSWIEQGAYIFVCGDASKMAKDVDKTLQVIAQKEGGFSTDEAKTFFKELRKVNRYQRDVY